VDRLLAEPRLGTVRDRLGQVVRARDGCGHLGPALLLYFEVFRKELLVALVPGLRLFPDLRLALLGIVAAGQCPAPHVASALLRAAATHESVQSGIELVVVAQKFTGSDVSVGEDTVPDVSANVDPMQVAVGFAAVIDKATEVGLVAGVNVPSRKKFLNNKRIVCRE